MAIVTFISICELLVQKGYSTNYYIILSEFYIL